jgi:hypothetical protein
MPRKSSKPTEPTKPRAPRRKAVAAIAAVDAKCVVCGDPVAPFCAEKLCWVCRRLKISAWRDSDGQTAMQE